jgi:MFS family permease
MELTPSEPASTAESLISERSGKPQDRIWKVGTLSYTFPKLVILFGLLLGGDFAWAMRDRAVGPIAQLMLRSLHAPDLVVGLLLSSLPTALGLIVGPIISMKSDRHRGRWGRRIPFLIISAPFAAISMFGLAFTPWLGKELHQMLGVYSPGIIAVSMGVFVVFWTIFDLAGVVANSVFGGLVNDVVPQNLLGRFFGLFRMVSLGAGIIFNYWVMGSAEEHFAAIFVCTGALYGVGFSWMCFKVKEGEYPVPEPFPVQGKSHWRNTIATFKEFFEECFKNPYYLWLFGALTLCNIANGPFNAFSVFYAKSIDMSMDSYGKYLALTYVISLSISYMLGYLSDRFHPLRACIPTMGLYAIVMLWGGCFAKTPGTFAIGFVLHGVLSGTYFTVSSSLCQRLFPKEKFAQFVSGCGLFGSVFYLSTVPLSGYFLDHTGHVYRHTFTISGILALFAFVALLIVHSKFMKLGGPKNYMAPE